MENQILSKILTFMILDGCFRLLSVGNGPKDLSHVRKSGNATADCRLTSNILTLYYTVAIHFLSPESINEPLYVPQQYFDCKMTKSLGRKILFFLSCFPGIITAILPP